MISQRISGIMLHVSDENIVPIDEVKRAIRSKFHIHRPKISIGTYYQILPVFCFIPGATVPDFVLFSP